MDARELALLSELAKMMQELSDEGVNAEDVLLGTRTALLEKKKASEKEKELEKGKENKVTTNKIRVYEHTSECYIFQDGRNTRNKTWSMRIWDKKRKQPLIRSLRTEDQAAAITIARDHYMNFKSRGAVYLTTDSITTKGLVGLYENKRRKEIAENPQESITLRSFDAEVQRIKHWVDYITEKGYIEAKLENIPPELGLDFAQWIRNRKITTGKRKGERKKRSNSTINQCVSATKRMYHKVAHDGGYITANEIPKFAYLKKERNKISSKDLLQKEELEVVYKWMKEKYPHEEGITHKEYIKRRIYNLTFTIHNLTGMRPKELLGVQWFEIRPTRQTEKGCQDNMTIHIPVEKSKTGKARDLVAPIKSQLDRLKYWYEQLGHKVVDKKEFVFLKLTDTGLKNNAPMTAKSIGDRLKHVIKGVSEDKSNDLDLSHLNITNYSSRHYYITDLLFKDVSHHTIARQVGTGTTYIDEHYSHLIPEMKQKQICDATAEHEHLIMELKRRRN